MGLYGSDTSTTQGADGDDLDTAGAELPDGELIAEDILRAVTIREGALWWAPEDTLDVTEELGAASDATSRATLGRRIETALLRDERYESVTASVDYVDGALRISIRGETSDAGPFSLELEPDGNALRVVKVVTNG